LGVKEIDFLFFALTTLHHNALLLRRRLW